MLHTSYGKFIQLSNSEKFETLLTKLPSAMLCLTFWTTLYAQDHCKVGGRVLRPLTRLCADGDNNNNNNNDDGDD